MEKKTDDLKQDIRLIRLAKWQIPKTKSVFNYMNNETHLAVGYFDMIDISKVKHARGIHPLLAAYKESHRHNRGNSRTIEAMLGDYTTQELMIFTNKSEEGLTDKAINDFWKNKEDLLYISLIHMDNEVPVSEIVQHIKKCFAGKQYLYYFSFDYSGVVLLAKNMELQVFLNKMFELNYSNNGSKKIVRDSYSFYGFHKERLKAYFKEFDSYSTYSQAMEKIVIPNATESFAVSVNVGIQNYNLYKKFIADIKSVTPDVEEYGLFGRHDCSIVNPKADLKWLIFIQYLLNKYTIATQDCPPEHLISTHETFVKLPAMSRFEDTDIKEKKDFYNKVQMQLDKLCNDFFQKLDVDKYNGEYKIPVQAVRYSILSILKNRFAEDFVLCMCQSFAEFLEYLTEKMQHEDDDVIRFDRCFSAYFRGLNSLVNSAMHSERQFIQATAFNAIIYDVPSKIMAFYIAMINEMQALMSTSDDMRYTFLLTPSFSNEISVEVISYDNEIPPHDRILMVSINENSLYNPGAVIRRMAHEVAHFAGDELRCREYRKKNIKLSAIYIVLSHVIHGSFLDGDELYMMVDKIEEVLSGKSRYSDKQKNYSQDLLQIVPDFAKEFQTNTEMKGLIIKFLKSMLRAYLGKESLKWAYCEEKRKELREYLLAITEGNTILHSDIQSEKYLSGEFSDDEIEMLVKVIYRDVAEEIRYINEDKDLLLQMGNPSQSIISVLGSGILNQRTIAQYWKTLISIYSEAFSDVQMILLTGLTYENYLKGFITEENISIDRLSDRLDDVTRVAMVTFSLQFTGIWGLKGEKAESDIVIQETDHVTQTLHEFDYEINKQMELLKRAVSEDIKEKMNDKYYGIGKEYSGNSSVSDTEEFWEMNESVDCAEDNVNFYLYQNVVLYLIECIEKSVKEYNAPEKKKKIKHLRENIETVLEFKDVEAAFSVICNELNTYKGKMFAEYGDDLKTDIDNSMTEGDNEIQQNCRIGG